MSPRDSFQGTTAGFIRAAIVVLIVAVTVVPGAALAQTPPTSQPSTSTPPSGAPSSAPGLGIEPVSTPGGAKRSSFVFAVGPGDVQDDAVKVSNLTDQERQVFVYAANGFTTPAGLVGIRPNDSPKTPPVPWLKFSADLPTGQLTLAPKTSATIPFRITIPPDAVPGDYAFGIGAAPPATAPPGAADATNTAVVRAVAVSILLRVNGDLHPSVRIATLAVDATPPIVPYVVQGETTASVEVVNDGNERLSYDVEFIERNIFGHTIHREVVPTLPNALPGSHITIRRTWHVAPYLKGSIEVNVKTSDPGGTGATRTVTFWSISVPMTLTPIVMIVAAIYLWRRRRRGKRVAETDQPRETHPHEMASAGR